VTPAARRPRPGYTLFELLVVLAILILLAAVVIPSTSGLYGGSRPRAAADQVRGEVATARAYAMEEGRPYRVAISADGTRIRRAPDAEFDQGASSDHATTTARSVEYAFEHVTAQVTVGTENGPAPETGGWLTIAVVMPDGTCRDDGTGNTLVTVSLREVGMPPESPALQVLVRGVTGQTRVVTPAKGGQK
jgi:prepilin-type N-terminal cleavage/methylation domain-containing protein